MTLSPMVWKGSAGQGVEEIIFMIKLDYFFNFHYLNGMFLLYLLHKIRIYFSLLFRVNNNKNETETFCQN